MNLTIIDLAHHRNGIGGAPFAVILFEQDRHCAVLDVDKLVQGDITFGSNSWRGDRFEPSLRQAIRISSTSSERS